MSLGLATKGILSGSSYAAGSGGEGGIYPAGYIASAIAISVDLDEVTQVDVDFQDIEVAVDMDESIGVDVSMDSMAVSVSAEEETIQVDIGTVEPQIIWYWQKPYEFHIDHGSLGAGELRYVDNDDSNILEIHEESGTPGWCVTFRFINVGNCARTIHLKGYYSGNPAHIVKIQVYDQVNEEWINMTADARDFPSTGSEQTYQFDVPSPCDAYMDNNEMLFRVIHTSTGTPGHDFYINHLYLGD